MLTNYVVLKVEGGNLNKFLNMLVFNKVLLAVKKREPDSLIIMIRLSNFRKVVNITKKSKSRFHVLEKRGIYFLLREVTIFKLISIVFSVFLLFLFNLFIFDIKINPQNDDSLVRKK
ncbi:sporulation protein YqfD [Caldicellulosiruptor naganoensis]|uniref:Sporulation protein YqfD n=1 Tax=Caldicellulosiruptor naganoensis TaxID=29324 RepID=A0ABY7BG32_9FIRM|nr:sporulation protein YqfD [Caldicellulosiruptor naganoensis]WAM30690.1 sporulation protein YqfD [Caldicellulosiruptor naganoensis]